MVNDAQEIGINTYSSEHGTRYVCIDHQILDQPSLVANNKARGRNSMSCRFRVKHMTQFSDRPGGPVPAVALQVLSHERMVNGAYLTCSIQEDG